MRPALGSLILYTRKIGEMTAFYETFFGYSAHQEDGDRILTLQPLSGGIPLLLHLASSGVRQKQAVVQTLFFFNNISIFCHLAKQLGLSFGKIRKADGHGFANTKNTSEYSVSVSGRFG